MVVVHIQLKLVGLEQLIKDLRVVMLMLHLMDGLELVVVVLELLVLIFLQVAVLPQQQVVLV